MAELLFWLFFPLIAGAVVIGLFVAANWPTHKPNIEGAAKSEPPGRIVALICVGAIASIGAWSWYEWEQQRRDPYEVYYRLTVDISDKLGRSIGINIVVGCSKRRGYIIGGGSYFSGDFMYPAQYAWLIPDGHALSVGTYPSGDINSACQGGTTDNGRIARDWLPFVIWYEDASNLSHGLAYATQDAYVSPRAQMFFHGARISRATVPEYMAFKARGLDNLIPPYFLSQKLPERMAITSDATPEMVADPKKAWRRSGPLVCRGVVRVPVPPVVHDELSKWRPTASAKYWHLEGSLPTMISNKIRRQNAYYDGSFMRPDTPRWSEDRPKVYPMSYDGNLDRLTKATFSDGSYHKEVRIVAEDLGFMDCGRKAPKQLEAAVTGRQMRPSDNNTETCFIDSILIGERKKCKTYNLLAFEGDDYALDLQDFAR